MSLRSTFFLVLVVKEKTKISSKILAGYACTVWLYVIKICLYIGGGGQGGKFIITLNLAICYNTSMNKLSLYVITKNEEKTLGACLKSVQGLADEIILVDSFSTDKTLEIAKKYGAKIYQKEFINFKIQKQFALDKCSGDWVLNLDADEELSPKLKQKILEIINKPVKEKLFFLQEQVTFLGRKMKHSGLTGHFKERLAYHQGTKYIESTVHEKFTNDGPVGYVRGAYYYHTPYTSIEQYFNKFNLYSTLGAQYLFEKGKKFHVINLFRQPFDFIKTYILHLGFLDGIHGFLWAWFSSVYPTVKYAKLWHLHYKAKQKSSR